MFLVGHATYSAALSEGIHSLDFKPIFFCFFILQISSMSDFKILLALGESFARRMRSNMPFAATS